VNNTCVANDANSGFRSDCNPTQGMEISGNTVYTQSGTLGSTKLCDHTNVVKPWPSDAEVIAMGKKIIGWTD
jgi:hypothetical protein